MSSPIEGAMTASLTVTLDGGEILIRATDADLDVGIPLTAREARSVAAHLVVLAEALDARARHAEPVPARPLEDLHSDELTEGTP